MASAKRAVLFFLLIIVTLCGVSHGAIHKVGESAGWTTIGNIDYQKWASTKHFHVGDSLVFEYNNQFHNVKQVTHKDFQSCNAMSSIAVYTSGSDSISLKRPGHYYFLCGFPGHCQAGQKVDILVTPPTLRASPSPSPSSSPAPYGSSPVGSSSSNMMAPGPAQSSGTQSYHQFSQFCLSLGFIVFCAFAFAL